MARRTKLLYPNSGIGRGEFKDGRAPTLLILNVERPFFSNVKDGVGSTQSQTKKVAVRNFRDGR